MLRQFGFSLMAAAMYLIATASQAAPIDVHVLDALSNAPQAGLRVDARELLNDGSTQWLAKRTTDSNGVAQFDLSGLGSGGRYVFKVKPLDRDWVSSAPVDTGPTFFFAIGQLPVTAIHPDDKQPLASVDVTLREVLPDGSLKWVRRYTTDANGQALFDAPGLGAGRSYLLEARSPLDNGTRRSETLTAKGAFTFQVGNDPVRLSVLDALSQAPLTGLKITAEELDGDRFRWRKEVTTDAAGTALLDLTGLGSGREYRLRASPWGHAVYTPLLTTTGPYTFALGSTQASVISGATGAPIAEAEVGAFELDDTGKRHWRANTVTDTQGIARFDLPGLGEGGASYQLRATSLVDGNSKYSQVLNETGAVEFVVGNAPLTVTVKNHFTGEPLAGQEVLARERLSDGSSRGAGKADTDQQGVVVFDLEGLGSGREYFLQTTPYTTGRAQTLELDQTGTFDFTVGKLAIQLKNQDSGAVLAGKRITVYEKTSTGRLRTRGNGDTDSNGMLRFDPYGLGEPGRLYIAKAFDPLGDGKDYYSDLINTPRQFVLGLTPGQRNTPDLKVPNIALITPQPNQAVADQGVRILGVADDNEQVEGVRIRVFDGSGGATDIPAQLSRASGFFTATVPETLLQAGTTLSFAVLAEDDSANVGELAQDHPVQPDTSAPALTVDSHTDGATVYRAGFLVSGEVGDDTQIDNLNAQLSSGGSTLLTRALDWSYDSGRWSLFVPADTVPAGADVDLLLVARDMGGNPRQLQLQFTEADEAIDSLRLARRGTFGPTPELLADIRGLGSEAWLTRQLDPDSIDDSALDAVLAAIDPPTNTTSLQIWAMAHMLFSEAQLREVMTQFWDNHFNTNKDSHGRTDYEVAENEAFRANAFGHFRDLLAISAKSPAMLLYLDNARSRKEDPNENYPREVLELHTMGVNGGYTQQDIEEIARALTGWTVRNRAFFYEPRYHDDGEKTVLGHMLPAGGGINDGELVLDILAEHPATAGYICTKLLTLFVADTPDATATADCAQVFTDSNGHIGTVVGHILRSPGFSAPDNFQRKTKTPLEQITTMVRATDAHAALGQLRFRLQDLGMPLFRNPIPTGYAEVGDQWINSQQIQERVRFANEVVFSRITMSRTHLADPLADIIASGHHTAEGITGYLGQLSGGNDWSDLEWNLARGILRGPGDPPFDIGATDAADEAIRNLIGTLYSLPAAQLQ